MNQNLPTVIENKQPPSVFLSMEAFENGQRMAQVLAKSQLIPQNFQNNLPDCIIALELAMRIGASPMAVLQNTYIVHGKPGYSATFIIAMINTCGRYSPLRFDFTGEGDDLTCVAWAKELATGERLEGPPISIDVAKKEGWFTKKGSKWQTMPDLMLRYRAATFFGRMYAPELLMGMRSVEELKDTGSKIPATSATDTTQDLNDRFSNIPSNDVAKQEQVSVEEPETVEVEPEAASNPSPKKQILLRRPAKVAELTKAIGAIDSLKNFEIWLTGAGETIDKNLEHDLDKKEVKGFIDSHHASLTESEVDAQADNTTDDIDSEAVQTERKKINKLKSTDAIDKWRFANHERLSSAYSEATVDAIMSHASDVYSILQSDGDQ